MAVFLVGINLASALAAGAAAVFWLRSALHRLPPMDSSFGGPPPNDPFFAALQAGVRLNRNAAACACAAALLQAVAALAPIL